MMRDAESHSADDVRKREEIEARNRLDGLVYQMEKTVNDNREKVGAVAGEVESAIAVAKKALADGGVGKLNEAFNELPTASHKLSAALYHQAPPPGAEPPGDQRPARASSSSR